MGRPTKSNAAKTLTGAHPRPELKPGTPKKPANLSARASQEWDRLAGELEESGIMVTVAHRGALAFASTIAADVFTAWTGIEKDGAYIQTKTGLQAHLAGKRWRMCLPESEVYDYCPTVYGSNAGSVGKVGTMATLISNLRLFNGVIGSGGTSDSSPPLQWRVNLRNDAHAVGTPEMTTDARGSAFQPPLRDGISFAPNAVKTPGYLQPSLRDEHGYAIRIPNRWRFSGPGGTSDSSPPTSVAGKLAE